MGWLKVLTGRADPEVTSAGQVVAGFRPPGVPGVRRLSLADLPYEARASLPHPGESYERGCCPLRMHFHASIADLGPGEAQVLRLRHRVNDEVIGGCTVVLLGIGS